MSTTDIITQDYEQIFGRAADASGLRFWATAIDSGTLTANQVISTLIASPEAHGHVDAIAKLYQAAFNRAPDASGDAYWVKAYAHGMNLSDMSAAFARSSEFHALYGAGADISTDFLDALYQNVLGRAADTAGRDYWQHCGLSRAEILRDFAASSEFRHHTAPTTDQPSSSETFALSASASSIDEGSTVDIALDTTNLAAGTTLDYTISGTGITAEDFVDGSLTGTLTVDASGKAVLPLTLAADAMGEGPESFTVALANGKASVAVDVNDTSTAPAPKPTFEFTASQPSVDEGGTVVMTLVTTNVPAGTTFHYKITGAGITAGDLVDGAMTGTLTVNESGQAVVPLTLADDALTEGPETLTIKLLSGKASTSVVVKDTSLTPPTYALTTDKTSVDEGGTVNVTLATTNLAAGSTVEYTISGGGITAADIAGGLLTGTFTVDASGQAVVPLGLLADATTEASETLTIALANGKASADVVVNDTSLTPAVQPTYSLTTDRTNVDEGGTVNVTLATTNLAAGSTVDYTISGTGISGADFAGGLLTGTFTIDAAGQAVVPLGLLADATTERPETLTIALANGKASADVVVNDTSVTPPTYALTTDKANADEGGIVNVTLATTNLVAGSTVDYTISGAGISAADVAGGLLTGTFTVDASGQAVVPLGLLADATTEGSETLTITLANGKASADVVVNDTSLTPTYALTTDKAKVDEGGIVNVTLATTNLVAGSTVDYTISGAGITPADVAGGLLTGTFKVDASGQAVVPLGLLADATTEGPETLTIALANGKASADVVVNDTSVTTINVTSANAAKPSDVSSGDFDVDLAAGNYATEITGFAAGDKIGLPTAFLSTATVINNDGADGVITITGDDGNGNVLTVNLTGVAPGADAKVYGVGSFNNAFGAGSLFDDTPPPPPTFALKTDVANVDEGKTVNVTLQTTNVATGTTFDYRISGTGITAADFVGGALTGTFTVDASGKAVVPLALAADGAVEGAETLSIALVNGKASAQVLINDASVTPPVDPGPTTLNVTSANAAIPNDVSAGDFTVDLAAGNYATQVIGFAAGDKIGLPTAFLSTATVTNTDGTDGNITISGDNGNGNVLTVNLTGVAPGADAKVYGVGSFNNTFGAGSLFDDTPATPPVNPSPSTVNITAANAGVVTDMSAGNVTAVLAAGNYDTELSGFVAGDKIDLPAAFLATAALTNTDATDGMFTIAGDDGNGNVLTVNLSGVALTADAKVWSITTFNNTFGAGSLY